MTNLQKLVAKCMRYARWALFQAFYSSRVAALTLIFALLQLGAAQAQPVTLLNDQAPMVDLASASTMWIDASGQASIAQISATQPPVPFTPTQADAVYSLGQQAALWQHYRFAKQADSREDWILEFPQPLLDRVTVYQSNGGSWTSQTAGDTVPVASWPEPGRYAQFRLDLHETGVHDVYVRLQNVSNVSIPVKANTQGSQTQYLQLEYLAIGAFFGALLLLITACLTQSWVYRDYAYAWYAVYASILTLTMAAWTGVAGHLVWRNSAVWNDVAPGCLGVLTGATALLFINHLCRTSGRKKPLEILAYAMGLAGLALAPLYAFLGRPLAVRVIGVYLSAVAALGLAKAFSSWRRGDVIGLWVLAAFMPMAAATVLLICSVMGLVASSWLSRYGLMMGVLIEVPLLLIALNLRSRERHNVQARAQVMASHDALTGLLAAPLFHDRLKQIISRMERYKEPAAVLYIELANYGSIKKTWGTEVAEQSLLRSVLKLRRILSDVDTMGRVEEARFGLVLEGTHSRQAVTDLSVRLIAAGLMPLKGLKPDVILQFHVASVLLTERMGSALHLSMALGELIAKMGQRTRRQIRFLEPQVTRPATLDDDPDFEPDETQPRLNAVGAA